RSRKWPAVSTGGRGRPPIRSFGPCVFESYAGSTPNDPRSISAVCALSEVAIINGWLAISKSTVTDAPGGTLNTSVCVATALGTSVRNGWPSAVPSEPDSVALETLASSIFGFKKYRVVLFLTITVTTSVVPVRVALDPLSGRFAGAWLITNDELLVLNV